MNILSRIRATINVLRGRPTIVNTSFQEGINLAPYTRNAFISNNRFGA